MAEALKLVIHRAAHQIGGNCIELVCGGCRLSLDAGRPLDLQDTAIPSEEMLPSTLDLASPVEAVLLSHPHKDHYGLAHVLPGNPRIYGGADCLKLIEMNARIFGEAVPSNLKTWSHRKPFTITPFLTDHSAFDAYMVLIECVGRRLLYSGDFRMTGRKSRLVERMIKWPPEDVDILLMEGATLGRRESFPTKTEAETRLVDSFRHTRGRVFVTCSAQNVDRIVPIYRACLP